MTAHQNGGVMRTTINIEKDVLNAARELARQEKTSIGEIVSRLLRKSLTGNTPQGPVQSGRSTVAGFRPFPDRGVLITNEVVDSLRDREGL